MREAASFIASQTRSDPAGALPALASFLQSLWRQWNNRRQLRNVTELDDHLLCDIGLTREDVRWALDLPFSYEPGLELQRRALRNRRPGWRG
jgi:uncharacterized protein YjiS (DUF1127 family)